MIYAVAPLLLTAAELIELTGYKRPSDQSHWLEREGIPYRLGADGKVKVVRAHLVQSPSLPTEPTLVLR